MKQTFLLFLFVIFFFLSIQAYNENKKIGIFLSQQMSKDTTLYWRQLTQTWLATVRFQSNLIWRHWKESSANQLNINKKCLDVVEYMIQHPIEEEWAAKCKF